MAFDRIAQPVYRSLMPAAKPNAQKSEPIDFEKAIVELESIVTRLEQGDLPLEDSLRHFERGVELTRACQTALQQAEQKVEILLKKSGQVLVEDFDNGNADA
jgi:exodeoxyribonuclease VII small subunit